MSSLNITMKDVAKATGAQPKEGWEKIRFTGVSTDSRTIKAGELFIALKGDRFNGHDYNKDAFNKGAAAVVVVDEKKVPKNSPYLKVADTLTALGNVAGYLRRMKRHKKLKVVAVTGSNGKTTTKEMIASILGVSFKVQASQGNLNNLIGLPTSMFGLRPEHEVAVLEMGMNRPGEIARLTEIADPTVGLITNVGPAHIEGVGSIEGVARAKGELFAGLSKDSTALVNIDDPLVQEISDLFNGQKITFGFNPKAMVRVEGRLKWSLSGARFILKTPMGKAPVHFNLLGRHNVANALASAAVATALGLTPEEIAARLEGFAACCGRLELKRLPGPAYLLDDSYNANPASAQAALSVLRSLGRGRGRLVAAFGDMLELGSNSRFEHDLLGRASAASGLNVLAAVGQEAKVMAQSAVKSGLAKDNVVWFADAVQAADWLKEKIKPHDRILVKGSRGMRMEQIVERLGGGETA